MKLRLSRCILCLLCVCICFGGCQGDPASLPDAQQTESSAESESTPNTTLPSNGVIEPEPDISGGYTVQSLEQLLSEHETPFRCDQAFLSWCDTLTGGEVFCRTMTEAILEKGYSDDLWLSVTGRTWHALYSLYHADSLPSNVTIKNDHAGGVVNLAFVGDINMADSEFCMQVASTQKNGPIDCIAPTIVDKLNRADLAFCNNEFVFSIRGYPIVTKKQHFRTSPENVSFLRELGIDIVSVANNHIYDYSTNALVDTLRTLESAGIGHVGAGENLTEAKTVQYYVVNGLKVAYISASCAEVYLRTPVARDDQAGVLGAYDPSIFYACIKEASEKADYVIAVIHAGNETSLKLDQEQVNLARKCIDYGADMVIGSHPQNAQSMEYYKGCPIVYSLGNFWYGRNNTDSFLLNATLGHDGISLQVTPCRLVDGFVRNAEKTAEGYAALHQLKTSSEGLTVKSDGTVLPTNTK